MNKTQTVTVKKLTDTIRLVDYCPRVFGGLSTKSATKRALKRKEILINGRHASGAEILNMGDILQWQPQAPKKPKKLEVDLPIVHEDEQMIIVNKPAGIATNGNRYKTVENAIINRYIPSTAVDALSRPMAVHRLDVPTRGLLILAKTREAQIQLGRSFQGREIHKTYHAIVHGQTPVSGQIDLPVDGKSALTEYHTIRVVPSKVYEALSLVRLAPHTGRKHQLRIHLAHLGHMIVGDKMYAQGQKTILGKGVYLAATGLKFPHPTTRKIIEVTLPVPPKFLKLLDREEMRSQ